MTTTRKKGATVLDGELHHQRQLKLTHLTHTHEPSSIQRMYPCKTSEINTLDAYARTFVYTKNVSM